MKYSYTFIIKMVVFIISIFIFYPIVDKYLNWLLGIKEELVEGFVWSKDTVKNFNEYQDTVNSNNNQFNIEDHTISDSSVNNVKTSDFMTESIAKYIDNNDENI